MKIIAGMHRSGTSLLARVLYLAGADLGPAHSFYPADRWNPEGYYEQTSVLTMNVRLLEGGWGKASNVFLPSTPTTMRRAARFESVLAKLVAENRDRVLKDPRFNIVGPAWEKAGAEFTHLVLCLRNPHEVADSLWRRNRLPRVLGLRTWTVYFSRFLENYGCRPYWVVDYEKLVNRESGPAELAGLLNHLEIDPARAPDELWREVTARRAAPAPSCNVRSPFAATHRLWQGLKEKHTRQAVHPLSNSGKQHSF